MKNIFRKIFLVLALVAATATVNAQNNDKVAKALQGMSQEQIDAIKAQLPQGVTLEILINNLPEGMSLTQALQMMAAQRAQAQKDAAAAKTPVADKKGWEFFPFAGVNLGMTSSLGTPKETRSVEAANYNFNYVVGGYVSYLFGHKFGIRTGLLFERKGNNSNVIMKDYFTKVHIDNAPEETQGYFSGRSQGWHDCYYLTVPLALLYQPNRKWDFFIGPYFSYAVSRDRHGLSSEGTIRESLLAPVAPVDHSEADNSADVSKFDCGVMAGITRQMWNNIYVTSGLSFGLVNVWDGSAYGMNKNIYNIYVNLGFGYKF